MFKQKRIWIPILSALVIAMGCGLFYRRKVTNQEPVEVYKPVDLNQPATPKPPPPGETYETGHWHGDEWHANDAHAPVEAQQPTAEARDGRGIAEPVNAQTGAPMPGGSETSVPSSELSESSQRTQAEREAFEKWQAWEDKVHELRLEVSQAHKAWADLIPETAEEVEKYKTDKEWQRKAQEATDKYDEVLERMQEHEANRVLPPPQSFR